MEMPNATKDQRRAFLEKAHGNVALLPSTLVEHDLLTDSLQHLPFDPGQLPGHTDRADRHAPEEIAARLFGFPHNILVGQGRMAEAIVSRLLVRPGTVIPSNLPFATTRLHQELCGGRSVEMVVAEARDPGSKLPFKGNIDVARLERDLREKPDGEIAYVCVESCVNAVGGQPISMANLRHVSRLAHEHGVPLVLDATRILENAFHIREREDGYAEAPVWEITRSICDLADAMTLSLTKDFGTPVGGLIAVRDQALLEGGLDVAMAMGDGLSLASRDIIAGALHRSEEDLTYIESRMQCTRRLHDGVRGLDFSVVEPAGGHAVLVLIDTLLPHLDEDAYPVEALNHDLYISTGLRGTPHEFPSGGGKALACLRLAVPIHLSTESTMDAALQCLAEWRPCADRTPGLRCTHQPPTPGGRFRAWYEPIEA